MQIVHYILHVCRFPFDEPRIPDSVQDEKSFQKGAFFRFLPVPSKFLATTYTQYVL